MSGTEERIHGLLRQMNIAGRNADWNSNVGDDVFLIQFFEHQFCD